MDAKTSLTSEERLDQHFRRAGTWDLEGWREERTGGGMGEDDRLLQKEKEEDGDVLSSVYADDTQCRTSAKTKLKLERQNTKGLNEICRQLKALRMKIN